MICNDCIHFEVCGISKVLKTVTECPYKRTDVVEVVRCKDCKYYRDTNDETYCNRNWWNDEWHRTYPDDYCSCGERKKTE